LKTLGEAKDPEELRAVLDAVKSKGWDYLKLYKEMDSDANRAQSRKLPAPAMSADQKAAAIKAFASGYTPESQEQAMGALLSSATDDAQREVLLKACAARGISVARIVDELDDPQRVKQFKQDYA